MEKMEPKYNTIKLPIEIIYQVDRYMDSHKHEGFTTRVEVIKTALREFFKNGRTNYQPPESGEERTIQGGNENEQMDTTERHDTRMDSVRLSVDQGEQEPADESRVEDPTEKIKSTGGEDDPTS